MWKLYFFLAFLMLVEPMILIDFDNNSQLKGWYVVDDVVMGGRSAGSLSINEEGHAVFEGKVSLENNGGFSSVRYYPGETSLSGYSKAKLHVKGDGSDFQFRIKSDRAHYHSYIAHFETSGEWQVVEIPLSSMYAGFRGRKLSMPNYPGEKLEEIAFLIGNKKAQSFRLEIDKIAFE